MTDWNVELKTNMVKPGENIFEWYAEIKVSSQTAITFRFTFVGKAVNHSCVISCLMMCLSGLKVGVQQFQMRAQTAGLKRATALLGKCCLLLDIFKMLRPILSPFWE